MIENLIKEAVQLLKQLIATPSLSREENDTAQLIENQFNNWGIKTSRKHNNVYAFCNNYDDKKPTLLLNSHHDTVKPNSDWTMDPFKPTIKDGKLFGLGSNDAGASLVSLMALFAYFNKVENLNHNMVSAATGEEENSGENGICSILSEIGNIDLAIIGEPTGMQMAVAEKGLLVLRCQAKGKSGHAARDTGINAITNAIKDIEWFHSHKFPKVSSTLGQVKMSVTIINAGTQHNVLPDKCDFTVDIRSTDVCSNDEILEIIKSNIDSEILKSSLNLNPSGISVDHTLVQTAKGMGVKTFGSPTLSDQAMLNVPSVKIGPGMSERSHTANEFVYLSEIEDGIINYIQLLEKFLLVN
ncbi:MAG: M20 family metallo-hydrolase [Calditrichia bacterium]|nr:M20 family metallo-hydrolase [Calditrichia bacterium]